MKVLALECSTIACSTAAMADGVIAASCFEAAERYLAERLAPMIVETMGSCGWRHRDLDAYAVTIGPGSFTGLRVGLATAKALSLAAQKPLIGLPTLTTMAWTALDQIEKPPATPPIMLACFLESGKSDFYAQIFTATKTAPGLRPLNTIITCKAEQAADWIPQDAWVCGDTPPRLREAFKGRPDVIFAASPRQDSLSEDAPEQHPPKKAAISAQALAGLATATYAKRSLPDTLPQLIYGRRHYAEKPTSKG